MSTNRKLLTAEFEGLMNLHKRIIFKVTHTYCRNSHDREDLAQEIQYQLWRAFPKWDRSRKFTTWMYRIALNVAISFVRKNSKRASVLQEDRLGDMQTESTPEPALQQQLREMYALIDSMNRLDRALLMLYLDQHPYLEIAEILGISESNVATKISRLKKRLSNELNPAFNQTRS